MALIKNFVLENETSGDYWTIIDVKINYITFVAVVILGLFKSKEVKEAKYAKGGDNNILLLTTKAVTFTPDENGDFAFSKENVNEAQQNGIDMFSYTYSKCKTNIQEPFFADAVDDL